MDGFPHVELRTPRLHLTTDGARLADLADLARTGIHDPRVQPFGNAWTDTTPEGRARSVHAHWREHHMIWDVDDWHLPFIVLHGGDVVGTQDMAAKNFGILGTVHTGSWLGLRHQRQGFGTEMRAAVLHLAFAVLHAGYAETSAHADNTGSNTVSRRLGYQPNGTSRRVVRGAPVTVNHYTLPLADWLSHDYPDVEMSGDPDAILRACGALRDPGPV